MNLSKDISTSTSTKRILKIQTFSEETFSTRKGSEEKSLPVPTEEESLQKKRSTGISTKNV